MCTETRLEAGSSLSERSSRASTLAKSRFLTSSRSPLQYMGCEREFGRRMGWLGTETGRAITLFPERTNAGSWMPIALHRCRPRLFEPIFELLSAAWTAKRRSPYKHAHTASAVDTIALLSRRPLEQPEYWSSGGAQVRNDTNLGMFGDSETNRLVEVAAVGIVRQHYEAEGWTVVSRESDKCGYDLECSRGRSRRHVEVKGRSGAEVAFVLTQRELEAAETDSLFQLAVVTLALTETPVAQFYGKAEFAERFSLRPISYVARLAVRKDAC